MQLDAFIPDYHTFMDELAGVVEAQPTRFYVDTSLLMLLVGLRSSARTEFIDWCENRLPNSIRVPVWAAHEFHRHIVRQTINSNVRNTFAEVESKLYDFMRLALERADEDVCQAHGYAGRDSYISEVGQSYARILKLAKIAKDETKISEATEQVITFVNKHVLETDLIPIVARLGKTGEFRFSHLMPPGYHDKKKSNRYGDVVIWEEMIADIAVPVGTEARCCVLISCDEKTDWVSTAPLIRSGGRSLRKSNREKGLDVTRPHPLLVHEFVSRAQGERVYVLHPRLLALAVAYKTRKAGKPSDLPQLLATLYQQDPLSVMERGGISATAGEPALIRDTQQSKVPDALERTESIVAQRLIGATVSQLMAATSVDEIRSYTVASPTERSSIIQDWLTRLKSGELKPLRFGRLLADLIIEGRSEWVARLPNTIECLKNELDDQTINQAVLGAITPAYFDLYGHLRTRPEMILGAVVLTLEQDPKFADAFNGLKNYLEEADAELPHMPGGGRKPLEYSIDVVEGSKSSPHILRDLRIGGHSAFADSVSHDSARSFSTLFDTTPDEGCTGRQLRCLVAREFIVPADLLTEKDDKRNLTWPPNAGLVSMDTSSPGGLSAVAEEGEE